MPSKPAIRITKVIYGRTVMTDKFESTRFDLTAEVQPGQTWEECLEELRTKCLEVEEKISKEGF